MPFMSRRVHGQGAQRSYGRQGKKESLAAARLLLRTTLWEWRAHCVVPCVQRSGVLQRSGV